MTEKILPATYLPVSADPDEIQRTHERFLLARKLRHVLAFVQTVNPRSTFILSDHFDEDVRLCSFFVHPSLFDLFKIFSIGGVDTTADPTFRSGNFVFDKRTFPAERLFLITISNVTDEPQIFVGNLFAEAIER